VVDDESWFVRHQDRSHLVVETQEEALTSTVGFLANLAANKVLWIIVMMHPVASAVLQMIRQHFKLREDLSVLIIHMTFRNLCWTLSHF
jgi:6-phosphogluconate dehydrogenase (decarboxylating)